MLASRTATACLPSRPALPACCFATQSAEGTPMVITRETSGTSRPMLAQLVATSTLALA